MSGSIDGPTDGFERTFWLLLGKKRLAGDTAREATSDQVNELKAEARQLDAGRGADRKPTAQKKCVWRGELIGE